LGAPTAPGRPISQATSARRARPRGAVWSEGYPEQGHSPSGRGNRRSGCSKRPKGFSGHGRRAAELRLQPACAVHTHDVVTGGSVGSVTRRSEDGREPPPRHEHISRGLAWPGSLCCVGGRGPFVSGTSIVTPLRSAAGGVQAGTRRVRVTAIGATGGSDRPQVPTVQVHTCALREKRGKLSLLP
jgi:hypothetical protein